VEQFDWDAFDRELDEMSVFKGERLHNDYPENPLYGKAWVFVLIWVVYTALLTSVAVYNTYFRKI
jgi:hypothetical protein